MTRVLHDRYRLHRRIGGGGMGAVFEAEDAVLQRRVAVKVLHDADTTDPGFLREARALSRLRHPGIVQLYDAGSDGGDAYLVLELVRGRTLRAALQDGPLDAEAVAGIGRALAESLAHAHSLGVVHRDLSPGNVLLDEQGGVRLADFGIARLSETTATLGGEVWGTPAYMAPEQVAGEPVGPAADVYALGLVLLEALTASRAFPGPPHEAGLARLHRAPAVPDDLPGIWPALLRAMTVREPLDRPHAVSVASRLGASPAALRTLAVPTRQITQRQIPAVAQPTAAARARRGTGRRRRSPLALVGALLASALLTGLALQAGGAASPSAGTTAEPPMVEAAEPPPDVPPAEATVDDHREPKEKDKNKGGGKGKGKGNGRN